MIPAGTIIDFDSLSDSHEFVISHKGIIVIPRDYAGWSQHSKKHGLALDESQGFTLTTSSWLYMTTNLSWAETSQRSHRRRQCVRNSGIAMK